MKKLSVILLMMFGAFTVFAQDITVESTEAPDVDFAEFKTFDWADQVDNELDAGLYFLNDLVFKAQIREAVRNEMLGAGYDFADDNADLVVNFRVFDKPTTLRSAEDFGPGYWGSISYTTVGEMNSYDVEAGTLMISLVDRESGKIVWHGFASGLIDGDKFVKDEGAVVQAVNMIFRDYSENISE